MDEPMLCIQCLYYRAAADASFDRCVHPSVAIPDYVRGEMPTQYCQIIRLNAQTCGPAGKLWKPWFHSTPHCAPLLARPC